MLILMIYFFLKIFNCKNCASCAWFLRCVWTYCFFAINGNSSWSI